MWESSTLAVLRSFFDQDEVRAIFQSLDLSARDSWTLFKLLDEEGNGDINLMDAWLSRPMDDWI